MTSVGESSSFYNTRERSTRTRTVFGKGGPILAANFGPPGILFLPRTKFFVTLTVHLFAAMSVTTMVLSEEHTLTG